MFQMESHPASRAFLSDFRKGSAGRLIESELIGAKMCIGLKWMFFSKSRAVSGLRWLERLFLKML